jgi:mannose-6-phosphate isomerase-like protein (cupin superfamily)
LLIAVQVLSLTQLKSAALLISRYFDYIKVHECNSKGFLVSLASDPETVRVVDSSLACPNLPIVEGTGNARAVLWPGNGAIYRTFHVIDLEAGAKTVELKHPSDAVYYVASGSGSVVDAAAGTRESLIEGAMVHIDAGDRYRLENEGAAPMRIIGGPCPADPAMYAHLKSGAV